jgi:hypothetical protein
VGNSEGYQDYKSKTQRKEHNHRYHNNVDRQAHDYGYQQGLLGKQGYRNDDNTTEEPLARSHCGLEQGQPSPHFLAL